MVVACSRLSCCCWYHVWGTAVLLLLLMWGEWIDSWQVCRCAGAVARQRRTQQQQQHGLAGVCCHSLAWCIWRAAADVATARVVTHTVGASAV